MSGPALMVCGTSSDVGKSRLVTGLCRAFARRGLKVAPFKGQNMALNSVVTPDGAEIGRAQAVQARAAGAVPEASMNPVLLKPTSERSSQVVVMGRPWKVLDAAAYHRTKPDLLPTVLGALADLRSRYDLVVCEGAGSPAEVNLMEGDLVNLGLAQAAGVPAVLVGDIDRGGVFAHLYGTVALLPVGRRRLVRGFLVNKLRGDPALLGDAAGTLERRCGVPTLGVVPYVPGLWLDAEDSLGLGWRGLPHDAAPGDGEGVALDVALVQLPRISNFTDVDPLAAEANVNVRPVEHAGALGDPDLVVLPGSKSTVADLAWLRSRGLDRALERCRTRGSVVVGLCAGYQMLGREICDPAGVESPEARVEGLGMLPVRTVFGREKVTRLRTGSAASGGEAVEGYEIHHGCPEVASPSAPWFLLEPRAPSDALAPEPEGVADAEVGTYGTSLHGVFETDVFRHAFLAAVARRRGKAWRPSTSSFATLREAQIDLLADTCDAHLDLDRLLDIACDGTGGRDRPETP